MYEDHDGSLWIADETAIWRWGPGIPTNYPLKVGTFEADGITEDESGRLLLATGNGLKELIGGRIHTYQLPGGARLFNQRSLPYSRHRPVEALGFFRSRDGSLWIATLHGLLHVHQGRTDMFRAADGLSGDFVSEFLEDREGTVWVNTESGLDRFRELYSQIFRRIRDVRRPTSTLCKRFPMGRSGWGPPRVCNVGKMDE